MTLFLVRCQLLLMACFWLVGCTPSANPPAADLIQAREWRIDNTGQQTLQAVQSATDWQALPEWNTWGFGEETVWVRLKLKAEEVPTNTPWVVRVRPAFLDYVTLYDPASGLVARNGDALPPSNEDLSSIHFRFQIPPLPHERTIYLQMRSTSARTLHAEVLPYGQDLQKNRLQEWAMGFVLVCSAIFGVWAFMQWSVSRDKVIGVFALKQLFATAWAFFFLGFGRLAVGPWLPEGVLSTISSMVVVGVISVTLWFMTLFFEGYQPARWALALVRSLALLVLGLPLVFWLVSPQLMLKIANQAVVLSFSLGLLALLTAVPKRVQQPIPMAVFLVYFIPYGVLNSLPALIHLGVIPAHPIMLFGGFSHAVMDGIVMFILLQVRARNMRKEQMQTALDLQRSQERTESEKRHRQEQSQLFAMLAHEVKTPLATLRMWMEAGQLKPEAMERAIADMNQVIELCVHTGQLADQGLQPDWQTVDPLAVTRSCIESCRSPDRVDLQANDVGELLRTDAQMLSIVLGNLLDNACKYGAAGSRIQVRLQRSVQAGQAGWHWQVRNEAGPAGLPDATRLFEKYYRSPLARRFSGSGLGLFLVKGLLDLMQGGISYSARGTQAAFGLWLPQAPAPLGLVDNFGEHTTRSNHE